MTENLDRSLTLVIRGRNEAGPAAQQAVSQIDALKGASVGATRMADLLAKAEKDAAAATSALGRSAAVAEASVKRLDLSHSPLARSMAKARTETSLLDKQMSSLGKNMLGAFGIVGVFNLLRTAISASVSEYQAFVDKLREADPVIAAQAKALEILREQQARGTEQIGPLSMDERVAQARSQLNDDYLSAVYTFVKSQLKSGLVYAMTGPGYEGQGDVDKDIEKRLRTIDAEASRKTLFDRLAKELQDSQDKQKAELDKLAESMERERQAHDKYAADLDRLRHEARIRSAESRGNSYGGFDQIAISALTPGVQYAASVLADRTDVQRPSFFGASKAYGGLAQSAVTAGQVGASYAAAAAAKELQLSMEKLVAETEKQTELMNEVRGRSGPGSGGRGLSAGFEAAKAQLDDFYARGQQAAGDSVSAGIYSIADALNQVTLNGASASEAIKGFAGNFLSAMTQIINQQLAASAVSGLLGFFGFGPGGIDPTGSPHGQFNAKGNAFGSGNVVPFAAGGVVSAPTTFAMSKGNTGLMGEAGPEAIMPLKRMPDGALGIRAQSGGGVNVSVTINASAIDGRGMKQALMESSAGIKEAVLAALHSDPGFRREVGAAS